jgi:hypothetical protein
MDACPDSSPPTPVFAMSGTSSFISTESSPLAQSPDSSPVTPADGFSGQPSSGWAEDASVKVNLSDNLRSFYSYENFASGAPVKFDDLEKGLFGDAVITQPMPIRKRRKSGESAINSVSLKLGTHFPSLGKRLRHHKNSSASTGQSKPSSRTSSFSSSFAKEVTVNSSRTSLQPQTSAEPSPMDSPDEFLAISEEPIDRKRLASTPLLPPKIGELAKGLLPSPEIGDPRLQTFPQHDASHETPDEHRHCEAVGLSINIPQDKWSRALGHANFTIQPEPYVPARLDRRSCRRLARDWEKAQAEFLRHQARTLEHYGPRSRTYALTEEKWTEINARWERCVNEATARLAAHRAALGLPPLPPPAATDAAVAGAAAPAPSAADVASPADSRPSTAQGQSAPSSRPTTAGKDAAPAKQVPRLAPSWDGNKFPKLGDADIVGPMVVQHGAGSGSDSEPSPASGIFVSAGSAVPIAVAVPAPPPIPAAPTTVAARVGGVMARKASSSRLFREFGKLFGGRGAEGK